MHAPSLPAAEDLAFAGAAEQARLLRARAISAPELLELHLERIARLDPALNAFRVVLADSARAAARAAQERLEAGETSPLLGVPVAVKDNLDVAGEQSLHGSAAVTRVAADDCEAVRRLRAAGAVIVGKTHLSELAAQPFTESAAHGITRNPWNPERFSGGSSGGSAVAVSAGLAAAAVGSDGGGSIRVPSAACGVFGLKPQRGRVSLAPETDHWHGLTVLGPIARGVEDAALLLDVLAETSFVKDVRRDPGRLRIGLAHKPQLGGVRVSRDARAALADAGELLRGLGHAVEAVKPDYLKTPGYVLARYFAGIADDADRADQPERLQRRTRTMARWGRRARRRALPRALRTEETARARLAPLFERCDVLVTPMFAQPLPRAGRWGRAGAVRTFLGVTPWVAYTAVWNATGQPAAAVPLGLGEDGLPVAVQLVGRPGAEGTLLALAAQIERARPWAGYRPSL
jgi:amidase